MSGGGYVQPVEGMNRPWRHKVTVDFGLIKVDGNVNRVWMCRDEVEIGCTTVSRAAIEKMAEWFDKHFPKAGKEDGVKLQ